MKWQYFAFAAFLTGAAMLKNGVPILPVAAGIALCGAWNLFRQRSRRRA